MKTRFSVRKSLIFLLLLSMLLAVATSVSAGGSTTTHQVIQGPVNFTIPAGQCPHLPPGLSITGIGKFYILETITDFPDGSRRIVDDGIATGTAVDNNGGTYRFFYANRTVQDVPPSGTPLKFFAIDKFILSGRGRARLDVAFIWRWTAPSIETSWPPHDNWEQIVTKQDPLHCDPI